MKKNIKIFSLVMMMSLIAACTSNNSSSISDSINTGLSSAISNSSNSDTEINSSQTGNSSGITSSSSSVSLSTSISISSSSGSLSNSSSNGGGGGGSGNQPDDTYTGTYYNTVGSSLAGNELKTALSTLTSTGFEEKSYSSLPTIYKDSDVVDGKMMMFYTGTLSAFSVGSIPSKANKEHVWPQSWYGSKTDMTDAGSPGADAHNVFPCDSMVNNVRSSYSFDVLPQTSGTRVYEGGSGGSYGENGGNLNYGTSGDPDSYNYTNKSTVFYPKAGYRGMTARALMYVATRYSNDSRYPVQLVDVPQTSRVIGEYGRIGKLSTLLQWHLDEPVSAFEIARNEAIFGKWHKNRNPFVDKPSYACSIWSEYNDNTRSVCANYTGSNIEEGDKVDVSGVEITSTVSSVEVSKNITLTAKTLPADATSKAIGWHSSNTNIATVNNLTGVVTGVGEGSTKITAYAQEENSILAQVTVTVTPNTDPQPDSKILTLTGTSANLPSSAGSGTFTLDNCTFSYTNGRNLNSGIFMINKSGTLYNTTPLPNILKITLTYASSGSSSATQNFVFGNSVFSDSPSIYDVTQTSSTGGQTVVISPKTSTTQFFRLDVSGNNLQATQIVIELA